MSTVGYLPWARCLPSTPGNAPPSLCYLLCEFSSGNLQQRHITVTLSVAQILIHRHLICLFWQQLLSLVINEPDPLLLNMMILFGIHQYFPALLCFSGGHSSGFSRGYYLWSSDWLKLHEEWFWLAKAARRVTARNRPFSAFCSCGLLQ